MSYEDFHLSFYYTVIKGSKSQEQKKDELRAKNVGDMKCTDVHSKHGGAARVKETRRERGAGRADGKKG